MFIRQTAQYVSSTLIRWIPLYAEYRYPPHEQLGLNHVTLQQEIPVVEGALSLTFVLLKNILVPQQIALMHLWCRSNATTQKFKQNYD